MNAIESTTSLANSTGTQLERKTGGMGKSDFLRLLTDQLRNQDPLNPMQDKDTMAQLAQFSALEETQAMRTAMEKLASGDQISQAASLLGKKVTGSLPATTDAYGNPVAGRAVSGIVSGITMKDGETYLKIGGDSMPLSYTSKVETP